jgi:hypothetical protein
LSVQPLNFALKSEEDQNIIVGQYQNFLNSLNFPIQILVQSRRLDVMPYLDSLKDKIKNISNELLRLHANEYIEFIHGLTELSNIMDKKFYVVVGFDPPAVTSAGLLGNILGRKEQSKISFTTKDWAKYTQELSQRVDLIVNGLNALSLPSRVLETQEAIELYYNSYNPEEARLEKLSNAEDLEHPIITAKEDHHLEEQMESIQLPSLNEIANKKENLLDKMPENEPVAEPSSTLEPTPATAPADINPPKEKQV